MNVSKIRTNLIKSLTHFYDYYKGFKVFSIAYIVGCKGQKVDQQLYKCDQTEHTSATLRNSETLSIRTRNFLYRSNASLHCFLFMSKYFSEKKNQE